MVEVRAVGEHRWAILGEVWLGDQMVAPLAVMIRLRDGLITQSRSYLTDTDLLKDLGFLS